MPLLSICIPTFNRSIQLASILLDLQACSAILGDQIEILVSDNCSSDATEELVEAFSHDFPIKYFRQDVNTGPTSNYLFLLSQAIGTYCWVTGDDDKIFADEIIRFVNFINSQPVYCLFVVDTQLPLGEPARLINFPNEGPYGSSSILFSILKKSLYPFGHYTSLVFNTSLLRNSIVDIGDSRVELGFWPHQFFLLSLLWNSSLPAYIYRSPLAMQGPPLCTEIMSIVTWSDIESSRLRVISSSVLRISTILKLACIARELFSLRILKILILLSITSPASSYPFFLTRQKKEFLGVAFMVLSLFPLSIYYMSALVFAILNKYSRLYIRLCNKYGICPASSVQMDSHRYIESI